jgi:hypothetical protein
LFSFTSTSTLPNLPNLLNGGKDKENDGVHGMQPPAAFPVDPTVPPLIEREKEK